MYDWLIAGLFFGVLLILLFLGVPVAFALGFVAVVGAFIVWGIDAGAAMVASVAFHAGTNYVLAAIPLFILIAELLVCTGLGKDVFDSAHKWFGWLPGGMAVASVAMSVLFASCSGSSPANAAAMGLTSIPEMIKRGYNKGLAAGAVCAGGALGILIPPSIALIIYGLFAEQSVTELFFAGFMPGIVSALLFAVYAVVHCSIQPNIGPASRGIGWSTRLSSTIKIIPILILSILILGSIYMGLATPTEAAGVGAVGVWIMAFILRKLKWDNLNSALKTTASSTAMIFLLIIGAVSFGNLLAYIRFPQEVTEFILAMNLSKWAVFYGVLILLLVMGCFVETSMLIMVMAPLIIPVIGNLGFNLVWFGIVFVIMVEIGLLSPPVGLNLFVIKALFPEIEMSEIYRGVLPFIVCQLITLGLVIRFPEIALWLPSTLAK